MINKLLLSFTFILFQITIQAQQYGISTLFRENNIRFNPAMTHYGDFKFRQSESDPYIISGFQTRQQWLALKNLDNVQSYIAYVNTDLTFRNSRRQDGRVRFGGYGGLDKLGPIKLTSIYGQFAYRLIPFNEDTEINIGFALGYLGSNINFKSIHFNNPSTVNLNQFKRQNIFEFIPGIYFSHRFNNHLAIYTGASFPRLFGHNAPKNNVIRVDPVWHANALLGIFVPTGITGLTIESYARMKKVAIIPPLYSLGGRIYQSFGTSEVWLGLLLSHSRSPDTHHGIFPEIDFGLRFETEGSATKGIRIGMSYSLTPQSYLISSLGGIMEINVSFYFDGFN